MAGDLTCNNAYQLVVTQGCKKQGSPQYADLHVIKRGVNNIFSNLS